MILADKIINERKKNGWSQEELADKLEVSRQAVSKWESAQSIQDLKRVIAMAQLFNVSTDYLLKDEFEQTDENEVKEQTNDLRKVSMEDANAFMDFRHKHSVYMAGFVALCIISAAPLLFFEGMVEDHKISENVAIAVGVSILLILVALSVFYFVQYGIQSKKYEYMTKEIIETEYGVTNLVKEKNSDFESQYALGLAMGTILCIVSVIPLFIAGSMELSDSISIYLTALLLVIVSMGVFSIVRVCMIKGSFDTLLEEGDYSLEKKKENKKMDSFDTIYWCLITAAYLAWSFITMDWAKTWIVWPVAGVAFAGIRVVVSQLMNKQ